MNLKYDLALTGIELPLWFFILSSVIVSFLITFISVPTTVRVSTQKKLFDFPNERTSHKDTVPNLGGLPVFGSFMISVLLFSIGESAYDLIYISGALVILFFTGLKDDILVIDPKKKFFSQIIASLFIVIAGDIRITNFHDVLGLGDVSYITSALTSIFFILVLINAFNLIDGVDGLSSGIGVLAAAFFGTWFLLAGHYTYLIISLSLAGSLSAFFLFNVFGQKNKIFLGDTGAMIVGLVISVLTIQFLEFQVNASPDIKFNNAPAFAFALLMVPLFDTLRIFILRLKNGKSPFKADKNHIHHNLLKLGYSHFKITTLLMVISIVMSLVVILINELGSFLVICLILFIASLFSAILDYIIYSKKL